MSRVTYFTNLYPRNEVHLEARGGGQRFSI